MPQLELEHNGSLYGFIHIMKPSLIEMSRRGQLKYIQRTNPNNQLDWLKCIQLTYIVITFKTFPTADDKDKVNQRHTKSTQMFKLTTFYNKETFLWPICWFSLKRTEGNWLFFYVLKMTTPLWLHKKIKLNFINFCCTYRNIILVFWFQLVEQLWGYK